MRVQLLLLGLVGLTAWVVLRRRSQPKQRRIVQPQVERSPCDYISRASGIRACRFYGQAAAKPSKPLHPAAEQKRKEWAGIEPLSMTHVPQSSVLVRAKSGSLWLTTQPSLAVPVSSPLYTMPPLPQRTERYVGQGVLFVCATRCTVTFRHGRPRVIPLDDLMRDAIVSETALQVKSADALKQK
jgi:hypothetical protein